MFGYFLSVAILCEHGLEKYIVCIYTNTVIVPICML